MTKLDDKDARRGEIGTTPKEVQSGPKNPKLEPARKKFKAAPRIPTQKHILELTKRDPRQEERLVARWNWR
eukprot:scaffold158_cov105-Cylindrotheca_fusiformis.AAC.17